MILALLTFFNAYSHPQQTYSANIDVYQSRGIFWHPNNQPEIKICEPDNIDLNHVIDAQNFWNSQQHHVKFKKISYTKNCNLKPPRGVVLITNKQKTITRSKEYGRETTYFVGKYITSSYIEINTDQPKHIIKITIAHELGHSLGFKHCLHCKKTDIMQIE